MKMKAVIGLLLALFVNIPSYGEVIEIDSLSEASDYPRVILFKDASVRSSQLYDKLVKESNKNKSVATYVINYDEMAGCDMVTAYEWGAMGAYLYVKPHWWSTAFVCNEDFNISAIDDLMKNVAEMNVAINLLQYGEVEKAQKKIRKIYYDSEEGFIPEAIYYVGLCYERQRKFDEASNCFFEATQFGFAEAFFKMGYYYENGLTSAGRRMEGAYMNYCKAARLGHEQAIASKLRLEQSGEYNKF